MSSYSEGQAHQLMGSLEAAGYTPADVTLLGQFGNLPGILDVLHGRAEIMVVRKEEVPLNTVVRVNRSVRPAYPDWVDKVMNPELESSGPAEYDLVTSIALWRHDGQESGVVTGQVVYDYLREHGMLTSCLSLSDALEIQKKGVAVFRKVFGDNAVYFWKSVVQDRDVRLLDAPCLCVGGGGVALRWHRLGSVWGGSRPAVRFAS